MLKKVLAPTLACLCAAFATRAQAQSRLSTPAERSISLATTFTAGDRIDATASPLTYGGAGVGGLARYESMHGRWLLTTTASATRSTYSAQTGAPTDASEWALAGRLETSVVRQAAIVAGGRLGLGLSAAGSGDFLEHRYADVMDTHASFITGFATLGVRSTWMRDVATGRVLVSVDAPFAGLVYQPYADSRAEHAGPRFRGVSASQLHAADAALRYDFTVRGATGLFSEYRVRTFGLRDVEPIRSIDQSISIGISTRFGARGR